MDKVPVFQAKEKEITTKQLMEIVTASPLTSAWDKQNLLWKIMPSSLSADVQSTSRQDNRPSCSPCSKEFISSLRCLIVFPAREE